MAQGHERVGPARKFQRHPYGPRVPAAEVDGYQDPLEHRPSPADLPHDYAGPQPRGPRVWRPYPALTGTMPSLVTAIFGSVTVRTPSLKVAVVFPVSTGPGSGIVRANLPQTRSTRWYFASFSSSSRV